MSKYNVGDKFVIEIREKVDTCNGAMYRFNGIDSTIFNDIGLDKLKIKSPNRIIYFRDDLEKAKEESYESGLKDAWEATRKICCTPTDGGFTVDKLKKIFGTGVLCHVVKKFEVEEVVKKIKEYEEKINVGDVLEHKEWKIRVVVTKVKESSFNSINMSNLEFVKGVIGDNWKKTGQHYDLNEIFKNE